MGFFTRSTQHAISAARVLVDHDSPGRDGKDLGVQEILWPVDCFVPDTQEYDKVQEDFVKQLEAYVGNPRIRIDLAGAWIEDRVDQRSLPDFLRTVSFSRSYRLTAVLTL